MSGRKTHAYLFSAISPIFEADKTFFGAAEFISFFTVRFLKIILSYFMQINIL